MVCLLLREPKVSNHDFFSPELPFDARRDKKDEGRILLFERWGLMSLAVEKEAVRTRPIWEISAEYSRSKTLTSSS
jgi:hypothetical protein